MSKENTTEAVVVDTPVKKKRTSRKAAEHNVVSSTPIEETETRVEVDIAKEEVKGEAEPINTVDAARKAVTDYLNDKDVSNNLRQNAEYLEKRFHGNWFTLEQIIKKTSMKDPAQATSVMTLMCMKGFATRKLESKEVLKYKITLDAEQRVKILEGQLAELDTQRQALIDEIEKLKKK